MQSTPVPESDEEQLRFQAQLLNAVEQAILAVDLTGRIIFWNRFAETLYGWTEGEAQGRNIGEVLAAPLLMEAARANLGQLRRGKSWSGEFSSGGEMAPPSQPSLAPRSFKVSGTH
jgi:PAS domain S-box-containing protein